MNKQAKLLLIVVPICFALAALLVGLCFLDKSTDADKTVMTVVLGVWAFFIVPSVFYAIGWAKKLFNNADPQKSFQVGYLFGNLIFLLLIFIAPVSGVLWFVTTVKKMLSSK